MCELKKFCGIIPAFYACYDDHGEINIEGVKKLVRYFIDKGVAGIYVNGSSGECIYQTVDERKKNFRNSNGRSKWTYSSNFSCCM